MASDLLASLEVKNYGITVKSFEENEASKSEAILIFYPLIDVLLFCQLNFHKILVLVYLSMAYLFP